MVQTDKPCPSHVSVFFWGPIRAPVQRQIRQHINRVDRVLHVGGTDSLGRVSTSVGGMQVLKILLPKSEEVSSRKEERTCFCRHEEQYFESIEEVRLQEAETRRDAKIIARSGAVAFCNGPMRTAI